MGGVATRRVPSPPHSDGSGTPVRWSTPLTRWHLRIRPALEADELQGSIWIVENGRRRLDPAAVDDIYLLFGLNWQVPEETR